MKPIQQVLGITYERNWQFVHNISQTSKYQQLLYVSLSTWMDGWIYASSFRVIINTICYIQ